MKQLCYYVDPCGTCLDQASHHPNLETSVSEFPNWFCYGSTFRSRLFLDPYLGSIIILIHYIFTVLGVYYHMLYSCKAKRVLH